MDSFWRTKAASLPERELRWPSPISVLSQLVITVVVGGLWSGLFFGFLWLTGDPDQTPPPSEAETAASAPLASSTPTLAPPTDTPTAQPAAEIEPASTEPPPADDLPALPTVQPTATETVAPTATSAPPTDSPPAEDASPVRFAGDIYPILERRCVKCHGGEKTEEGLVMTSHADLLKGSWNGPVLEPGDAENSFLVEQIVTGEMPKKEPRLLPAEIRLISDWIEAGALDN